MKKEDEQIPTKTISIKIRIKYLKKTTQHQAARITLTDYKSMNLIVMW